MLLTPSQKNSSPKSRNGVPAFARRTNTNVHKKTLVDLFWYLLQGVKCFKKLYCRGIQMVVCSENGKWSCGTGAHRCTKQGGQYLFSSRCEDWIGSCVPSALSKILCPPQTYSRLAL